MVSDHVWWLLDRGSPDCVALGPWVPGSLGLGRAKPSRAPSTPQVFPSSDFGNVLRAVAAAWFQADSVYYRRCAGGNKNVVQVGGRC
jgi:hypothetical protein